MTRKMARPFPPEEYQSRLERTRALMDERGVEGLLVVSPENVCYLCGLDHMGYFAYQALIVPLEGQPILVTRAMERATVRDQVPEVEHRVYSDETPPAPELVDAPRELVLAAPGPGGEAIQTESGPLTLAPGRPATLEDSAAFSALERSVAPAQATADALADAGLAEGCCLGLEMSSNFLPTRVSLQLLEQLPRVVWADASGLVESVRMVQSPRELEFTRQAAALSDSMMLSAIAAAGPGVNKRDVMATIYHTMFQRGGTYPGFIPLVRSASTLTHEHGTWDDARLGYRDTLFLEMSGCIRRYHAPVGRLVFIGEAPARARRMLAICRRAIDRAAGRIGPEVTAGEVYRAWHAALEEEGLSQYTRHHCGYAVGIGFPPSWSGSGVPVGLRRGSPLRLQPGMVFHLMSWLLRSPKGSSFLSDTVVVTEDGCERLTKAPRDLVVRR